MDDDSAQYAALEAEMAAPDPDIPGSEGVEVEHRQPEVEQYDSQRHGGVPEQQPQHHRQPAEQYQPHADVDEDPIAHFQSRIADVEAAARQQHQYGQHRQVMDALTHSENRARQEVPDYDDAISHLEEGRMRELAGMFPDGRQADLLAHQYGMNSAAELRLALLNRDRASIIDHAVRSGKDIGEEAYRMAAERGYQPKVALTKSQRKELMHVIENGNPEQFDKAWDIYAKVAQKEERQRR